MYESPYIIDEEGDKIEVKFIDLPDFIKETIVEVKEGLLMV